MTCLSKYFACFFRRSHPAQSGEQPDASFDALADKQHGETFDGPPTIERSGSEHRRAVTSPPSEEEGLGVEVEPSLEGGTGWFEKMKFKRNLFKVSFI